MKFRTITTLFGAAALIAAPTLANASAASLSVAHAASARAAAPVGDSSRLEGGNTAVLLGLILLVLIGVAAISGNGNERPFSP